jgi:hypothetical protein
VKKFFSDTLPFLPAAQPGGASYICTILLGEGAISVVYPYLESIALNRNFSAYAVKFVAFEVNHKVNAHFYM